MTTDTECEHRVQMPRLDPGDPEPFAYECKFCGKVTCRGAELSPIWGIPYVRVTPDKDGKWMGFTMLNPEADKK